VKQLAELAEPEKFFVVGKKSERLDSLAKVLGKAKYAADSVPHNALHLKVLRSRVPHAILKGLVAPKRRRAIKAFITAKDVPGINVSSCIIPDRPLIAQDRARSTADILAVVAAEDPDVAADFLESVQVKYEPLPVLDSPFESMKSGSVKIHDSGNVARHLQLRKGNVERGFEQADVILSETYSTQFQEAAPIEPEAGFAVPGPKGSVTVVGSMQNPFYVRGAVARILGVPEEKVRVIQASTGGAFGAKSDEVAMDIAALTALTALKTRRPAALVYTREESMILHSKRHPFTIKHKTGATKDGKLTAAEIELVADTGAYASNGPLVVVRALFHATGPYVVPNVKTEAYCVYTNNTIAGSFRGFGSPQAHFAAECQMDALAEKLDLDPIDFRLKNILRPGSETATGQVLDSSVGLEECIAEVRAASEWNRKRSAWREESGRKRRGIGVALLYHGNSIGPEGIDRSSANLTIDEKGQVTLRIGLTEYGTGARSGLAQIASEVIGVPLSQIVIAPADTETCPDSGGTFASRTVVMGGNAVRKTATALRKKLDEVASQLLQCDIGLVEIREGVVQRRDDPTRKITFRNLIRSCLRRKVNLSETVDFTARGVSFDERTSQGVPYLQYTFGAIVAEVEVDTLFGTVTPLKLTTAYDVGRAINPLSIEGQIEGGAAQALGYALMEEFVHRNGVVVNPSLRDYYLPTSLDVPEVESFIVERPGVLGPYGAKSMGEPPIDAPAPALVNAIAHAVGVRIKSLPATAEKILLALEASRT
jgi:CO/xanthine dehydrogenase Mo-binding subunit